MKYIALIIFFINFFIIGLMSQVVWACCIHLIKIEKKLKEAFAYQSIKLAINPFRVKIIHMELILFVLKLYILK